LALFGHKITLYRFNQGGSDRSRGAEPLAPLTLTTAPLPTCYGRDAYDSVLYKRMIDIDIRQKTRLIRGSAVVTAGYQS